MSKQDFFARLAASVEAKDSLLCVGLDPSSDNVPSAYRAENEPIAHTLLRWNRAIIEATAELACVYKPNIAFYEALGAPGQELLRATLASIPKETPILLDAKRGDIGSTAQAYAQACFEFWQVDAVTLSPYLGHDSIQPFLAYRDKGLFLLCHTSNPGAADFQHLEISDWRTLDQESNAPLYIHVARTAIQWSPQVGLVVSATFPQAIQAVREVAPETWFLVPGIGAQGGALEETVKAGRRADSSGLIINIGRGISLADAPGAAARDFRDAINRARRGGSYAGVDSVSDTINTPENTSDHNTSDNATSPHPNSLADSKPTAATTAPTPIGKIDNAFLTKLSQRLFELQAIKFGAFTLASGVESPIYIDLRLLVSDPPLLAQVAQAYSELLDELNFDRVAGVPYAALPIGTAVALHTGKPMIYPRKESKAYGLGKDIEGNWQPGERILVIEDLITSGGSIIQSAERLRAAGMIIEDCVVLIDRDQGGVENLAASGIRAHSVFRIHDLLDILHNAGHIDGATVTSVTQFLAQSKTSR